MQEFDSKNGGMRKLDVERARRAALEPAEAKAENEKFAADHGATVFDHPPLLPVDEVVFDPMHAVHTEANCLLDECVHQFLIVDPANPAIAAELRAEVSNVAEINQMWQAFHLHSITTRLVSQVITQKSRFSAFIL